MKSLEERTKLTLEGYDDRYLSGFRAGHFAGVVEQMAIDNLELSKLKVALEKELQINHNVIKKAWTLAYSMYQVGKDGLYPLTKDEFIKAMAE